MQDGLTALDLASLGGHPEVYQELVTHGKQYTLFFIYQYTWLLLSKFVCRFQSEMFCGSPVSVQVVENEPEPQPFEWTEDWVPTAFPTCAGSIEIECICFNYCTFVVITHKFCSVRYFSLLV